MARGVRCEDRRVELTLHGGSATGDMCTPSPAAPRQVLAFALRIDLRNFVLESLLQFIGTIRSTLPRSSSRKSVTAKVDTYSWRAHLIETPEKIRELLESTHRIAVLGIKPDAQQ